MLSRIIPVLIIFLFCFCSVVADINESNADEAPPFKPPENYLLVRPGENITISFLINCHLLGDESNASAGIPVPEIYTCNCFNNTYYHLSTEEKTYEYLTCDVFDENNLSLMKSTIIYVDYTFAPPKDEYTNSTVFFIQSIGDKILYLGDATTTETEMDFWWIWLIFIPFGVIAFISLYQMHDSGRRRRRREIQQRTERVERLMQIRNELSAYRNAELGPLTTYEPKKELMCAPPSPTVFKCKKVEELREFVKGDGLFEVGIKKFKVPSFDEQVTMIGELPEVVEFTPTSLEVLVNLNEYGKYFLKLKSNPTAHRIENESSVSYRNPYINSDNFSLCLGSGEKLYNRCFQNKNYVECIRVLCKVLKSKHGSGYRKWSDCGVN